MRTRLMIGMLVLAMALSMAVGVGAAEKKPVYGGTLHISEDVDAPGIDPQIDTTFVVYNLSRDIFNTLVRYGKNNLNLEPELLARMPRVSADGKTYKFELRKGVKFHDGTELTANDVRFTFERMLDPKTRAASTWTLEEIAGAQEMMDGKATSLKGFKVTGKYTFELTLKEPYAPFLSNLAVPAVSIFPEQATRKLGDKFPMQPVGTGPFKIKSWKRDSVLLLEKNKNYFEKGLPYLDAIELRIIPDTTTSMLEFENGQQDVHTLLDQDYERITTDPQWADSIVTNVPMNTYFLVFNVKNEILKDVRVRKAITMAVNRADLIKYVLPGKAFMARGFLSPGLPGYDPKFPTLPYDLKKAKELLAEAGYPNGFTIESWQVKNDVTLRRNEAIQAMLREIGIDMKIVQMDKAAWREARANGKIPMSLANWWADIGDPDNYLYVWFHSSQSRGFSSNYANPKVDELLEKARTSTDQATRLKMYQEAERIIINQDQAIAPLWHLKEYYLIQSWVHGFYLQPTGVMSTYKQVWLDKH